MDYFGKAGIDAATKRLAVRSGKPVKTRNYAPAEDWNQELILKIIVPPR